jgi:hypothetical protein
MTTNQYKIIRQSHLDEYGVEGSISYYIREHKTFLGIPYWKSIQHEVCGYDGCHNVRTYFKSVEEAETFIKEKLCTKIGKNKWVEKEVKQLNCN